MTRQDLQKLSTSDLLAYYNARAPKTVKRFADKEAGIKRVLALLANAPTTEVTDNDDLDNDAEYCALIEQAKAQEVAPIVKAKTATPSKVANPRVPKAFRAEPIPSKIHALRPNTVVANFVRLLARPEGATVADLTPFLSPKATIKGILGYDVRTLAGYGYESLDGVTIRLLLPPTISAPIFKTVAV